MVIPWMLESAFSIFTGGFMKEEVRNSKKKLVCIIDQKNKIIEITHKGITTVITVTSDGKFIINEE